MSDDKQTKEIKACLEEGQTFYPATRTILSEYPKVASKGQGKGKPMATKVCQNQEEYDDFMCGAEPVELADLGE